MAITRLNSLAIPAGTVEPADISYPLTNFSSTGIDDNATSTALTIDSSERLGVGTTSHYDSSTKLTVAGRINTSNGTVTGSMNYGNGTLLNVGTLTSHPLQLMTANTTRMYFDTSGNVGIGTTTVNADLHLGAASPHIDIGPAAGNRGKVGFDSNNVYIGSSSSVGEIHFKNNIASTDAPHSSGDTKMVIADSGVGIGTTSPSYLVDARTASGNAQIYLRSGGDLAQLLLVSNDTTGTSQINFGDADANNIGLISYSHNQNILRFTVNATETMRLESNGNLTMRSGGSFTANRADNTRDTKVYTDNSAGYLVTSTDPLHIQSADRLVFLTNGANERMRIDSSGRLLLGNPTSVSVTGGERQFQIQGTNGVTSSITVRRSQNSSGAPSLSFAKDRGSVSSAVVSGDALGAIYFAGSDGTDLTNDAASIIGWADGTPSSNNTPGRLVFYTNGGSASSTERMRITSSGNVGIGTSNLAAYINLHVTNGSSAGFLQLGTDSGANTYQYINFGGNEEGHNAWQIGKADQSGTWAPSSGFYIYNFWQDDTVLCADNSGRVGVGTKSPERRLHVSTANDYVAKFESTDSFAGIVLEDNNSTTDGNVIAVSGNNMLFYTAGGQRLRLRSDGGICFNGDSAAVNALDDYEEGTWSATDASGQGLTVTTNRGYYIKVGSLVHISASIVFPTTTNTTNIALNLPFTSNISSYYAGSGGHGFTNMNDSMGDTLVTVIENSGANVLFYRNGDQRVRYSDVSGARLDFHAIYQRT